MKNSYPMLGRYVVPDMPSTDELSPYLRRMDANRWYSNFGPLVTEFEDRLERHLSTPKGGGKQRPLALTTVASCYHALQIGLQLFRLPPMSNVLIPAVTFPACPLAVQHAGATPVLADIDDEMWQLTPRTARRTAEKIPLHAVMPVAVYGVPVPVAEWDAFVADTGIPVIIDAAAALDAQALSQHCLTAYSLHATKPFSVGEGGLLISPNPDDIEEARLSSNFGTQTRIAVRDGTNAKMSEYHGAVGCAQLDRWQDIKQRRVHKFARYRAMIEKEKLGLLFQGGMDQAIVSTVMLHAEESNADVIVEALVEAGIAGHRMYLPPLYRHPHFAGLAIVDIEGSMLAGTAPDHHKRALMVGSEGMQTSVFGVPFHMFMDDGDMAHVVDTLARAMENKSIKQRRAF